MLVLHGDTGRCPPAARQSSPPGAAQGAGERGRSKAHRVLIANTGSTRCHSAVGVSADTV